MSYSKDVKVPQALHLAKLAQSTPGKWVILPGGSLHILALDQKVSGACMSGWLTCLKGEAILDLPERNFVRLKATQAYQLKSEEDWEALPIKAETVLLFVPTIHHSQ